MHLLLYFLQKWTEETIYSRKVKKMTLCHTHHILQQPRQPQRLHLHRLHTTMSVIQELLKPGGAIALIPAIRVTILLLLGMVE